MGLPHTLCSAMDVAGAPDPGNFICARITVKSPLPNQLELDTDPASRWWLVRKGRLDTARHMLRRLNRRSTSDLSIDQTLEMIQQTNDFEKKINDGTSYLDCFKGVDLRRTEIVCVTWLIQTCAGATFMGYSTYFYQSAGLGDRDAFSLSLGQYAIGGVGTILSWTLMGYFGRRNLFITGLGCVSIHLLPPGDSWNSWTDRSASNPHFS